MYGRLQLHHSVYRWKETKHGIDLVTAQSRALSSFPLMKESRVAASLHEDDYESGLLDIVDTWPTRLAVATSQSSYLTLVQNDTEDHRAGIQRTNAINKCDAQLVYIYYVHAYKHPTTPDNANVLHYSVIVESRGLWWWKAITGRGRDTKERLLVGNRQKRSWLRYVRDSLR